MSAAVTAYIGVGSNLDDPAAQVERGLRHINELPMTRVLSRSSLYETAPVGYADQAQFVNAVAAIETRLPAPKLLDALLEIERRNGRVRAQKNGPRTLDLDILLYGDEQMQQPGLSIPHPQLHHRAFALVPLLEVSPACEIPGLGAAAAFLPAVAQQAISKRLP